MVMEASVRSKDTRDLKVSAVKTRGYKNTKLGLLPDDWDAVPLPLVLWFQEGPGLRNWQFRKSGMKVINVTNLLDTGYLDVSNTDRHISIEDFERQYRHFSVDEDDIVVASSGNSYCKTAVVRGVDLPLVMNTSVIRFKPKNLVVRKYAYAFLKSKIFKQQIDLMITGGAQPNFGPYHLRKILVPLPPTLSEQQVIADALIDTDDSIEELEALIAKKCQIKQGAMQELLSGQRRLPKFKGEWDSKSFSEIFDFYPTATNSRADLDEAGDTYYIHYGDIHTRFHSHLNFGDKQPPKIARHKCRNAAYVRNGDWIMADASEDFDGVCKSIEVLGLSEGEKVVSGLHTFLLREKSPTFVPGFKGHLGNLKSLRDQYLRVMTGMKVFGVSKTALRDLVLSFPEPKEQEAIVHVLSDMDADIALQEEKLEKVRLIKHGMMQELLTGRVRLV